MLLLACKSDDLDLERLSSVYGLEDTRARQAFLGDISDYFSDRIGGVAVLCEGTQYLSALRYEPYRDGVLISCLHTREDCRRKGYADKLISSLYCRFGKPLYSHVEKRNTPSMKLHRKCGFTILSDTAQLLDGTVTSRYCTLRLEKPF